MSAAEVERLTAESEAQARALRHRLARERWSVLDYQHRIGLRVFGPSCERRDDLAPIAAVWDRVYRSACGEAPPVIALVSAPPQVGKTMLGQYACARHITRRPEHRLAFITYGQDLASEKSREIRDIVTEAGVELRGDSTAVDSWATKQGGGLLARGRDGGLTGQSGLKAIWVCDPYKNRLEAESAVISQRIADSLSAVVMTRRHPETSVIVEHTRWTSGDVIARLRKKLEPLARAGVEVLEVNLPSVDASADASMVERARVWGEILRERSVEIEEARRALTASGVSYDDTDVAVMEGDIGASCRAELERRCPRAGRVLITFGGRDWDYYAAQRELVSDHDWWALYMGQPRAREGRLFRGATAYEHGPGRYAVSIGMDLAYTAKTTSDWSVAVVLARDLDAPEPRYYVLHIERARCDVTEWAQRMKALRVRYPSASMHMRTGGQEAALLDTMRIAHGLAVTHEPTKGDKYMNALACADDWNAGRILVPATASWDVSGFVGRVLDFSGQGGAEVDDEIDALVTAHKRLSAMGADTPGGPVTKSAGRVAAARGDWL